MRGSGLTDQRKGRKILLTTDETRENLPSEKLINPDLPTTDTLVRQSNEISTDVKRQPKNVDPHPSPLFRPSYDG